MSSRIKRLIRLVFSLAAWPLLITGLRAQVNVLTANYDNSRGNANLGEFVLNKANVNSKQFGKLYALPVDGQVYAQPLYVLGVNMATGPRDVQPTLGRTAKIPSRFMEFGRTRRCESRCSRR